MQTHNCIQKSKEWFDLKKQYPFSASKAQAIATAGVGLETIVDEALIALFSVGEKKMFTNEHLERGNELEEQARQMYELETGYAVGTVGFVTDTKYKMAGVSPDGLVNLDGLVEIKCLSDSVYLKKLYEYSIKKEFTVDPAYEWQMQMQLLFTDREWCDHVLYNPNFKKNILIQRVYKSALMRQKIITGLEVASYKFQAKEYLLNNII